MHHTHRIYVKVWRTFVRFTSYRHMLEVAEHWRASLWHSRTKTLWYRRVGVIYKLKCDKLKYDHGYIGKSGRIFGEMFKKTPQSLIPIPTLKKLFWWIGKSSVKYWCRFLILLVESWRIVIISGTVHWFWLKTSFHPLLWTSSGLTIAPKLATPLSKITSK